MSSIFSGLCCSVTDGYDGRLGTPWFVGTLQRELLLAEISCSRGERGHSRVKLDMDKTGKDREDQIQAVIQHTQSTGYE